MLDVVRKHYDATAEIYADHEARAYWRVAHQKLVEPMLSRQWPALVIDIGCGSGVLLAHLAGTYRETRFLGVDVSARLIDIARATNAAPNVEYRCGALEDSVPELVTEIRAARGPVVLTVMGALEYYGADSAFGRALTNLWSAVTKGSIAATFHNEALVGRPLIRQPNKAYWPPAAVAAFLATGNDEVELLPFTFALCEPIVGLTRRLDPALIMLERLAADLPWRLAARLNTNLAIRVHRCPTPS